MTSLIVCCDGTWKRADDKNVSNIERIARAIEPVSDAGAPQIVYYSSGVGTGGSRLERLLGGAFGIGLEAGIVDAYRFLALNYRPGDDIYVFGFSRGAYTARSMIGMINAVGLLTPEGVAANKLPDAMALYRARGNGTDAERAERIRAFREGCHPAAAVPIRFLGVFDTVGALGVPGFSGRKYRFHDVHLSDNVLRARQALALAERRRIFAPCLWGGTHPDMQQWWFDGAHTDVGGGYPESAIADETLRWMVTEAHRSGLRFDLRRIRPSLHPEPVVAHNSMSRGYRFINLAKALAAHLTPRSRRPAVPMFLRGWRYPNPVVDTGRAFWTPIARSAYDRLLEPPPRWPANPNVLHWLELLADAGWDLGDVTPETPDWPAPEPSAAGPSLAGSL